MQTYIVMNYEQAKAKADQLDEAWKAASEVLNAFPKGPMGLTPDSVKATTDWQVARTVCDRAGQQARHFNQWYVKAFKKERAEDRAGQLAALQRGVEGL